MDLLARLKRWTGVDDEESPYVCVYCGADLERDYAECPECHKPYVTSRPDDEN